MTVAKLGKTFTKKSQNLNVTCGGQNKTKLLDVRISAENQRLKQSHTHYCRFSNLSLSPLSLFPTPTRSTHT